MICVGNQAPFHADDSLELRPVVTERPDIAVVLARFGTGGVERVACILANGLRDRGFSTEVVVADPAGPARSLLHPEVPVRALGGDEQRSRAANLYRAIPEMVRYLRRSRPHLLLSPGNHTHIAAGLAHALAGRSEVSLVLKITNPIPKASLGPVRRFLSRHFYAWLLRRARLILVLSPGGIHYVESLGGQKAASKACFVHNPYILSAEPSMPRPAAGEPPLLLTVGRLHRQKNYGLLLDALSRLRSTPWRLAMVGEGPEAAMLKEKAQKLGLEARVDFKGYVPDPRPLYAAAKCLIISSRWEGLPAVALEAMGSGCPVVSTDCSPALSDIIKTSNFGKVVPPEPSELAAAIDEMLRRPAAGTIPEAIQRYSVHNGIDEHLKVLEPLLGSGRNGH